MHLVLMFVVSKRVLVVLLAYLYEFPNFMHATCPAQVNLLCLVNLLKNENC